MGASNVARVYQLYGRLDDRPLRVLVYMALIARDADAQPWFGQGHEALAELALALDVTGDPVKDAAALLAVRRAIAKLHRAGAITTIGRPTNRGGKARYRLWLTAPSPVTQRPVNNHPRPDSSPVTQRPTTVDKPPRKPVENGSSPVTQRPITEPVVGHSVSSRRSLSDRSHLKEEEEGGANSSYGSVVTARCGRRAREPP